MPPPGGEDTGSRKSLSPPAPPLGAITSAFGRKGRDPLNKNRVSTPYVFGPVPSRRLGLSLGVDLLPRKTCTYDCLYCQVGRTTDRCAEPRDLVPVEAVTRQVAERLRECSADVVTLSGSGEPTLHSGIHRVIGAVREVMDMQVAVLTNGSLLWRPEVRERLLAAHKVLPTLTSGYEETFQRIHRPHPQITLERLLEGLSAFRKEYRGLFLLEVVLLAGLNDTDREVERLREVIGRIAPDRVQLNTVARPPADPGAVALDRDRLKAIMTFLGNRAEIVAEFQRKGTRGAGNGGRELLEMIRRRPVRAEEACKTLGLDPVTFQDLIRGFLDKGLVREEEHLGTTFYVIS